MVIYLPDPILVEDLAGTLEQKPFRIVAELMKAGVFCTVDSFVDFASAAKIAVLYGFEPKRHAADRHPI